MCSEELEKIHSAHASVFHFQVVLNKCDAGFELKVVNRSIQYFPGKRFSVSYYLSMYIASIFMHNFYVIIL